LLTLVDVKLLGADALSVVFQLLVFDLLPSFDDGAVAAKIVCQRYYDDGAQRPR